MYLLGYIPKDNRLYLGDKELSVVSYSLQLSVLEYQTAVMRRDFETADRVLPSVPKEQRTRVAHFLEKQGFTEQALAVSTDPEHRFELSLQLGKLQLAYQLACEAQSEHKWKQLADLATNKCQFDLARECMQKAQDFGGLLLLATSAGNVVKSRVQNFVINPSQLFLGDVDLVKSIGDDALSAGMNNIAFTTRFISGDLNACLEILLSTERYPEAAFFARTYMPSQISRIVQLWKESLSQTNAKASQSLADPAQYENLFGGAWGKENGDLIDALKTEQYLQQQRRRLPASAYPSVPGNLERRPISEMLAAEEQNQFHHVDPAKLSFMEEEEKEVEDPAPAQALPQATAAPSERAAPVLSGPPPTQTKNLLDDDDDEFHPAQSVMQPSQGRTQLDRDLEFDLENLDLDDNVDTSEVNLDDDLLDD